VVVEVLDVSGQVIKQLCQGVRKSGVYEKVWDGTNQLGQWVGTGIYLLRLRKNNRQTVKRMFYVR